MLSEADMITVANTYLDAYRGILVIDPLLRFSVRVTSNGPASELVKDASSKLSWFLQLNVNQHSAIEDVRESVIDFLGDILLFDLDLISDPLVKDIKERISCRLFCALRNVLPDLPEDEE
jgi:hypothetical protein